MGRTPDGTANGIEFSPPAESSKMRLLLFSKDLHFQPNFGIGDQD